MKEYICNSCGNEYLSFAKSADEAECPECYEMDSQEICISDEVERDKWIDKQETKVFERSKEE